MFGDIHVVCVLYVYTPKESRLGEETLKTSTGS